MLRESTSSHPRMSLELFHLGKTLYSDEFRPDCRRLVGIFPPTILGVYDRKDLSYTMEYKSGINFVLSIDNSKYFDELESRKDHPISIGEYSPLIDKLTVYGVVTDCLTPRYEIYPSEGLKVNGTCWLRLGCGYQEILSVLGPVEEEYADVYLNFYKSGISIKVNSMKCAEKFIIHTNLPGHVLCGRFSPSVFELAAKKQIIHNKSNINDIEGILGNPGKPLVVNTPLVVQYFYTYSKQGLNFETNPNGAIASVQVM